MQIKTLKDLRDILRANGGKLEIGKVKMNLSGNDENPDVDVYVDGKLAFWTKSGDETNMIDVTYSLNQDWDHDGLQKTINTLNEKVNDLETENKALQSDKEDLLKLKKDSEHAMGKVEAYENILIGRSVTISA